MCGNTGKTGEKAKPGTRISFGDGTSGRRRVVDVVEEGNRLITLSIRESLRGDFNQLGPDAASSIYYPPAGR